MIALVVKPLNVQESVSADSEAPDIMFICPMVDYGIHAYIGAVKCTFMSKFCFCVLMEQIVGSCCEVLECKPSMLKIIFHTVLCAVISHIAQVWYQLPRSRKHNQVRISLHIFLIVASES